VAYTLRLDEARQEWHARAVAEEVAAAMGGDVTPTSWAQAKAAFDVALSAPPAGPGAPAGAVVGAGGGSGRDIRLRALGIA
jgi:hypothetical protein